MRGIKRNWGELNWGGETGRRNGKYEKTIGKKRLGIIKAKRGGERMECERV